MLEHGQRVDFSEKSFGADDTGNLWPQDLYGDISVVPSVPCEKYKCTAAGAELFQDVIAARELRARDTRWGIKAIRHMAGTTVLPHRPPSESFLSRYCLINAMFEYATDKRNHKPPRTTGGCSVFTKGSASAQN